jgi:hypothetical protein
VLDSLIALTHAIHRFRDNRPPEDDLTAVLIRRRKGTEEPRMKAEGGEQPVRSQTAAVGT